MFSGAQISVYPMTGDFVDAIVGGLGALDPYRSALRMETDDVSTLLVGPPRQLFAAMRDLHVAVSAGGVHCVLSACVSRGCPGEPDDPTCAPVPITDENVPVAERVRQATAAVNETPRVGQTVAAQFSLYPLGEPHHMAEIEGCIAFVQASGVFERSKNFCTKLRGDAGPVFAVVEEAFIRFGSPHGHVALDLTVSANSPSQA